MKGSPHPYSATILDEETVFLLKLFYLMVSVNAYTFLRLNQGLSIFFEKECPGREAHWLNMLGLSRYLISLENSRFLLCDFP